MAEEDRVAFAGTEPGDHPVAEAVGPVLAPVDRVERGGPVDEDEGAPGGVSAEWPQVEAEGEAGQVAAGRRADVVPGPAVA